MINAIVLRAPGTNCDAELCRALRMAGAEVRTEHLTRVLADPGLLRDAGVIGFPGGFSFGDDIAAGRVFAASIRTSLRDQLLDVVSRGSLVIGICNGFQVLLQCGLLPVPGEAQTLALARNTSGRFVDRWASVEVDQRSACVWTKGLADASDGTRVLPIAHAEGRLVASSPDVFAALEEAGQVPLRYADDVNGSIGRAAGVCDPTGRIFGLMPHPERYLDWPCHPHAAGIDEAERLRPTPGELMFRAALDTLQHAEASA